MKHHIPLQSNNRDVAAPSYTCTNPSEEIVAAGAPFVAVETSLMGGGTPTEYVGTGAVVKTVAVMTVLRARSVYVTRFGSVLGDEGKGSGVTVVECG